MGVPLSRQHVPALDGVRGVAILLVTTCHAGLTMLPKSPGLAGALRHLSVQGAYGVDLFFVLSGYLITGILLDTRDGPGYFRTFYWRRALRIFPAYYVYLALVFGVLRPALGLEGPVPWPYLVYVQNYLPGRGEGQPLLTHLWTLAVEEQFYLCWPALVYFMPRRRLPLLCGLLALGALGLRCANALTDQHAEHMADVHRFTPWHLDALLLGALLLAQAVRSERWLAWCRTWMPRLGFLAAAAILVLAQATDGFHVAHRLVYTAGWSLLAVLFGAVVFTAATPGCGLVRRMARWPWLRSFGHYSYAIYLFHPLITELIPWRSLFEQTSVPVYWLGVLAFPFVLAVSGWALAWVSWRLVEQPFLRLKDRFAYAAR